MLIPTPVAICSVLKKAGSKNYLISLDFLVKAHLRNQKRGRAMAKKVDLSKLSEKELLQLRKDVDKAISELAARKKKDAIKAAKAEASKRGFSLEELVGSKKPGKPKALSVPKYRHPENPEVTWSGRGRRPHWIEDALARGQSLEDFAI